jgi:hypothetical protein
MTFCAPLPHRIRHLIEPRLVYNPEPLRRVTDIKSANCADVLSETRLEMRRATEGVRWNLISRIAVGVRVCMR